MCSKLTRLRWIKKSPSSSLAYPSPRKRVCISEDDEDYLLDENPTKNRQVLELDYQSDLPAIYANLAIMRYFSSDVKS